MLFLRGVQYLHFHSQAVLSSPRKLLGPENAGTMQPQCQLQGEYVHKYIYNTINPQEILIQPKVSYN
jgi:hypothetical protein